ncbi:hypothetical protein Tco_0005064 [Tanacetum coccineum]
MDILRLEGPLTEKLGLDKMQPNVDQLMVPIHYSPDKVVIGATALSLALDVSSVRVQKIKENIANQRSALHDIFVRMGESTSTVLSVGMPISAGMTASVLYVNENGVSLLLDFIMVRTLVYGCLTEAKCWRIHSLSHQSLNGLSRNCFPLSETISPGSPNLQTMLVSSVRFYKMMNELVRNQYDATNHQVNVQFLLQLQPKWQRFVTLVKQSQELKIVSYHKLYDILKQHQNEVNEIRVERLACTANPLALVAQQQPAYHHQNHPTQNTQYSSTKSQQSTRNRGKAIVTLLLLLMIQNLLRL